MPSLASKRVGACGAKSQLTPVIEKRLRKLNRDSKGRLPLRQLTDLYNSKLGKIAQSTVHHYLKKSGAFLVDSYIKPALTPGNKRARIAFILERVSNPNGRNPKFKEMNNRIHVDEKWFFLQKTKRKVRLVPGEEFPGDDTCKHKSHIPKVMFFCAIGVPHTSPNGHIFDGKLGIWPSVENIAAKRHSKHRAAGTPVTTPVEINAETYLNLFTQEDGLLDVLKAKMGHLGYDELVIQQDNASPHVGHDNVNRIEQAARDKDLRVRVSLQPPNSPDLNKLDLCLFYSLNRQSAHLRNGARTLEELIESVKKAYGDYEPAQLERAEALLHVAYREVLEKNGGNQYDVPHSGIRKRQNGGQVTIDRSVPRELLPESKRRRGGS